MQTSATLFEVMRMVREEHIQAKTFKGDGMTQSNKPYAVMIMAVCSDIWKKKERDKSRGELIAVMIEKNRQLIQKIRGLGRYICIFEFLST